MKKAWRIWAKTLGYKISDDNREADKAAMIRTFGVIFEITVGCFIIANAIHQW